MLLVKPASGKENKETQQPSCFGHLNKGTKDVIQQNTKTQEKNKTIT